MKNKRVTLYLLASLLCWFFTLGLPFLKNEPLRFLKADPYLQALAVVSLVEDGDLDIMNQVEFNPGNVYDQSARGAKGEWFPVHETLLIFLGVPFYWLLGVTGLWIVNVLMSIGTALGMYHLAKRFTTESLAAMVCMIVFLTTPLAAFSYSFSVDTLAALGITTTFLFSTTNRPLLSGLLLGLSIWGRLANAAFLPAFLIYASIQHTTGVPRFQFLGKFMLGLLPGCLVVAALNLQMFGSVFETAYHHNQFLVDGELQVVSQSNRWSVNVLKGITDILFHPTLGLVFSWPLLIPAIALGSYGYFKRAREECLLALGLMASIILFYAPYSGAIKLGGGPRHFLIVYALCSCFCVFSFHRIIPSTRPNSAPN